MKRNILLSIFGGVLACMAFPNPIFSSLDWQGGFLGFVCLIPLLMIKNPQKPWTAWRLGLIYGFIYFGGAILWMASMKSMWPLSPLAWIILSAYLACYVALFLWGYHRLLARRIPIWIAAPIFWVFLELIREYMISGFPWVGLGYAHHSNPLMLSIAPVTGVWGLSWISVLINVSVYRGLVKFFPNLSGQDYQNDSVLGPIPLGWFRLIGIVALLILIMTGVLLEKKYSRKDFLESQNTTELIVSALQANIDQNQPWDRDYQSETLHTFSGLIQDAKNDGAALCVWPETAFPGIFSLDQHLSLIVRDLSKRYGIAQLVGADEVERTTDEGYLYYNTMLLIDELGDRGDQTSKKHLVPFGEYVPMKDSLLFFVHKIVQRYGGAGWTPGRERKVIQWGDHAKIGGLICFESIFPRYGRELVRKGSNLLVVISNDTWFGKTAAPAQHASFSIMRAAETSRYLVRAATTGVSCIISPQGNVDAQLSIDQMGQISEKVFLFEHKTLFVKYGNWLCWICGFVLFLEIFLPFIISTIRRRFNRYGH